MGEVISTFHVDIRLLIAQAVNFFIVFAILYYFAVRPLMKVLAERSKKIENSLKNAEQIEKELANAEKKREEVIRQAKREANEILSEVEKKGEERKKEMMAKAKEEIEGIVNKTKEDLNIEKQITLKHIKNEAAEMITSAMEKILGKKMNGDIDESYVRKVIEDVKK
ncbi:MAG: F0F1 ATP synthase subunit B [Patescibacteria group bacterium]|jgi:F-type H+-transporting ATPase subunit b